MRALEVHFQLMQKLADKVRTIPAKPPRPEELYRSSPAQTLNLHARIKELQAEGLQNFQIAERLHVSRATVGYHLTGKCSTAAKSADGLPSNPLSEGDSGKRGFPVVWPKPALAGEAVRASVAWLVTGSAGRNMKAVSDQSRFDT